MMRQQRAVFCHIQSEGKDGNIQQQDALNAGRVGSTGSNTGLSLRKIMTT